MKEFIEEVNEELRWERVTTFWKTYGGYVVGTVVAFFLGLSGWVYWDFAAEQKMIRRAATYEAGLLAAEKGEIEKSMKLLGELGQDSDNGYGLLARLKIAGLKPEEIEKNQELYEELAKDPKLDQNFRDLVVITQVLQTIDTARPIELADKLRPIENSNSPWRTTATEILGLLLVKAGNFPRAKEVYKALAEDERATPGIRARSAAMLDFLQK